MHEKIKKVISILIVFFLATTIFSTTISAKWFNSETTLKEKIEGLNQKTNDLIKQLSEQQSKDNSRETNKFLANRQPTTSLIKTLQSYTALGANDPTLRFYTNYNGQEKETRLKLFFETKIDVDGENGNDIGVRYTILPGIARPLSLSINFKLTIRQLTGFNQLDENAFFEGYAELYFPGILIKNLSGNRLRFGYQSPEGEKTPEKCDVIFKFIPNLIYPRKKAGFHFAMIPDATTTGKEKLNLLSGLAEMNGDTVVSEVYSKTLYNPAVETEISLTRSKSLGKRIFEFERQRSGDSKVDMYIAITEGVNSTYAYVKEVPELVTLSSKSGQNGFIEFDAHGEAVDEIGVCDDFENPINKAYFSNMFTKAKIEWNHDKLFLLKKGKANVSIYTEGEGASFNVHLEDEGNGSLDFSALSEDAIIDVFMELDLSEGYIKLIRSEFNLFVEFSVFVKNETIAEIITSLEGSLEIELSRDNPFEIWFDDLYEGEVTVHMSGKSFNVSDLDITGNSPKFGSDFRVTMDHLKKSKAGSINTSLSVAREDNNISGYCRFDIINGVQITNLSLKFNNFEFHRGNIDTTKTCRKWYNFSINVTFVEWHFYEDWGYVLVKGNSSAYFTFDSSYWDSDGVLIGIISGKIRFKSLSDVFNISWNTVDGNRTYSFDGSGVSELSDFYFMLKDKVEVNIPKLKGTFTINTFDKTGELLLELDPSTLTIDLNISKIKVTDFFEITLRGSIGLDIDEGSASGFLLFAWNESGGWLAKADFDLDVTGSIDIFDFEFNYQKNFADVSFDRIIISGNLAASLVKNDTGFSLIAFGPLTEINISGLNVYFGHQMLDLNLTDMIFYGDGVFTFEMNDDDIIATAVLIGESEIFVNILWIDLGIFEMAFGQIDISGPATITIDINVSDNVPLKIILDPDEEDIYCGYFYLGPYFLHVWGITGGAGEGDYFALSVGSPHPGGIMGVMPILHFDGSWHFDNLLFNMPGIPDLDNITIDGSISIEFWFDPVALKFFYLNGVAYEETTIKTDYGLDIVIEPGNFNIMLQQNVFFSLGNLMNTVGHHFVYIIADALNWVTFCLPDGNEVKFYGFLDLRLDLVVDDDGKINFLLDFKDLSGILVLFDEVRVVADVENLAFDASCYFVNKDGIISISDLQLEVSGTFDAIIWIKPPDGDDWIPFTPFPDTGGAVSILINERIKKPVKFTTPINSTIAHFKAWYSPPINVNGGGSDAYMYTLSYGDGSADEVIVTTDTEVTFPSHDYSIGEYTASITVTIDGSHEVYDEFLIIVKNGSYTGDQIIYPNSISQIYNKIVLNYLELEEDGNFHFSFIAKNNADEVHPYELHWETWYQFGGEWDGGDWIFKPSKGTLNVGETQLINVTVPPPDDHGDHISWPGTTWFGINNTNYEHYPEIEDSTGTECSVFDGFVWVHPLDTLRIPDLTPFEPMTSIFIIKNVGFKHLNWSINIADLPSNGTWEFSSLTGTIPPYASAPICFNVTADYYNQDLSGYINITNQDDPTDFDTFYVDVHSKSNQSLPDGIEISVNSKNVTIKIGGYTDINVDHFAFNINDVSGMLNGHFFFDTDDSYVYINWTKSDLMSLSLDGSAEFTINNFHFCLGENISINISRVITGGFNCEQGKSGSFHITVDDTFTDIDINLHLNHEFSNFTLVGNLDVDISSSLDGSLWIEWDLNGDIKNVNIDGDLFGYNYMEVSITDFNFTMNNFSFTADEIYFNRAVDISWNETDLYLESETIIQASDIHFVLNGDLDILITSGNIEIDGSLLFQFRIYDDHFRLYIFTTGLSLNGQIHVYFGDYYGYCTIFFTIVGEMWIEVYLD